VKLATFHLTVAVVEGQLTVALNGREARNAHMLWTLIRDSSTPLPEVKLSEPLNVSALVEEYARSGGTIAVLKGCGTAQPPQHHAPRDLTLDDLDIF